jgi:hypothetical protein
LREGLGEGAVQADIKAAMAILDSVPDTPPDNGDELPEAFRTQA